MPVSVSILAGLGLEPWVSKTTRSWSRKNYPVSVSKHVVSTTTLLHTLESQGIIQPVTELTEWCAPIVVAPKRDCDNVRICIDFSKLNKFVKREFYSSGTPMDAIADISGELSKIFSF